MRVTTVMSQMIVTDGAAAAGFYARLFGREPDDRPMDRLVEWHFDGAGAVQVYEEPERAGGSGATIGVDDLDALAAALDDAGIGHEPIVDATYVRVLQLADPDGNRIVFTGTKAPDRR